MNTVKSGREKKKCMKLLMQATRCGEKSIYMKRNDDKGKRRDGEIKRVIASTLGIKRN